MIISCKKYKILLLVLFLIKVDCAVTQPLKILIAAGCFPSSAGVAVLNQITGLIDRGCKIDICAKIKGKKKCMHADYLQYNLLNNVYYGTVPNEKYDIIYAQHGALGNNFINLKKELGESTKLVVCFRGKDITACLQENPHLYDDLFKYGDLFLPVCDAFKDTLIRHGCDPKKILVHHSAIDCELFSYRKKIIPSEKEAIKIVSVCRLVEKKGLQYAIHAIADLVQKGYNIEYTIVGSGVLRATLEELVRNLNLQDNIFLVGLKSLTEVAKMLRASHIFILPSITAFSGDQEGIPNALKEAMACGLPVVSTYHSGIPELIQDGKSGLLVEEANSTALSKAIEYLIHNPKAVEEMTYAASKVIEDEYHREKVNDRLFQLFLEIGKK
jgi:colanic acid/amylovoran biosynthesis glycosyltransferase